jgi:putative ABC transport system permease protein
MRVMKEKPVTESRGAVRGRWEAWAAVAVRVVVAAGVAAASVAAVTATHAYIKGWTTVIPPMAWAGGLGVAIAIGAAGGFGPPSFHPPKRSDRTRRG